MPSSTFYGSTITFAVLGNTEAEVADVEAAAVNYAKQFADIHEPALRYAVRRESLTPAEAARYAAEIGVDPAVFGLSQDGSSLQLELF